MGLFRCRHEYILTSRSNVLDVNNYGAVMRLCTFTCSKCGKTIHEWCDVSDTTIREVDTGKSVLIDWIPVNYEGS